MDRDRDTDIIRTSNKEDEVSKVVTVLSEFDGIINELLKIKSQNSKKYERENFKIKLNSLELLQACVKNEAIKSKINNIISEAKEIDLTGYINRIKILEIQKNVKK